MLPIFHELGIGDDFVGLGVPLAKVLGIVEHIIFLVAAEVAEVNVVDFRNGLQVLSPDHLQGESAIHEIVLGHTPHKVADGIAPVVHSILPLQGLGDGDIITNHKVYSAVDDGPQGGHIVVEVQQVVRVVVFLSPEHHILAPLLDLLGQHYVCVNERVKGGKGDSRLCLTLFCHIVQFLLLHHRTAQ